MTALCDPTCGDWGPGTLCTEVRAPEPCATSTCPHIQGHVLPCLAPRTGIGSCTALHARSSHTAMACGAPHEPVGNPAGKMTSGQIWPMGQGLSTLIYSINHNTDTLEFSLHIKRSVSTNTQGMCFRQTSKLKGNFCIDTAYVQGHNWAVPSLCGCSTWGSSCSQATNSGHSNRASSSTAAIFMPTPKSAPRLVP